MTLLVHFLASRSGTRCPPTIRMPRLQLWPPERRLKFLQTLMGVYTLPTSSLGCFQDVKTCCNAYKVMDSSNRSHTEAGLKLLLVAAAPGQHKFLWQAPVQVLTPVDTRGLRVE